MDWIGVAVFGLIGVFVRYGVDQKFPFVSDATVASFPWAILFVNLVGCLAAGYFSAQRLPSLPILGDLRVALLVGFCGGLTTFSTFSLQAFEMLKGGQSLFALAYLLGSPVLGVAAAALGQTIGRS